MSGEKLRNIGPKSMAWLRQTGVRSLEDLDSAEIARTLPATGFTLEGPMKDRGVVLRPRGIGVGELGGVGDAVPVAVRGERIRVEAELLEVREPVMVRV